MKNPIAKLAIMALLSVHGQAYAQDRQALTIAAEGVFPPWNSVNTSGEVIGFDIDVGKAICERAKLDCTFVTQASASLTKKCHRSDRAPSRQKTAWFNGKGQTRAANEQRQI